MNLFQGKENVLPMLGVRHAQILMLFACMVLQFCHRVNISIAMVAMVDKQGANPDFEVSFFCSQFVDPLVDLCTFSIRGVN